MNRSALYLIIGILVVAGLASQSPENVLAHILGL